MPHPTAPNAPTALDAGAGPATRRSALSGSAPVVALPLTPLALFGRRMAYEGWPVDLARLCTDAAYAHERLALAHTSSSAELRQAAVTLFQTLERNQGADGTLH